MLTARGIGFSFPAFRFQSVQLGSRVVRVISTRTFTSKCINCNAQGKVMLQPKASKSLHNIAMQLRKVRSNSPAAPLFSRPAVVITCALCPLTLPPVPSV